MRAFLLSREIFPAPVRLHIVAGFKFIASRTGILAFLYRTRADSAACAICCDEFNIVVLATQADKIGRVRFVIPEFLIHFNKQLLIACYRTLVGITFVAIKAAVRYHRLIPPLAV
jgi:hypothetical protein